MPDGSPLQVTTPQALVYAAAQGDTGLCSRGFIAGQNHELWKVKAKNEYSGGQDFQTGGLRVCLPGNSHARSTKVLSGDAFKSA